MTNLALEITSVFVSCLFTEKEIEYTLHLNKNYIIEVEGITVKVGFHKERINQNKEKIKEFINQMHPTFKEGWTFLNLCMTKDDVHWGEHMNCQELLLLAMAINCGGYCLERKYWSSLPGGVPYVWLRSDGEILE